MSEGMNGGMRGGMRGGMSTDEQLARRARLVAGGMDEVVPSPCLSVCRMDPATDFCEGCYRTINEIAAWGRMTGDEKRSVWQLIGKRIDDDSKP